MHKKTCEIVEMPEQEAIKKGYIPIPNNQLTSVMAMNRKQRRAWVKIQRKQQCAKKYLI